MRIAIYNRAFEYDDIPVFEMLFKCLNKYDILPVVYQPLYESLQNYLPKDYKFTFFSENEPIHEKTKFVLSMGGDGTMLDTVQYIGDRAIPILGINLGRLGFLAATQTDEIEHAVLSLIKDNYSIDKRSMIHLNASSDIFANAPYALNEFTLHRKDSSALIKIHAYLNGEFLCTYWADGLIVATPTGSTGYSLSCGGPIIFPQSNSFVITPVAPHNLNVRPIIVSDESIVSFEVEGRAEQFLCTMDARSEPIDSSVSLAVCKENFATHLIRLDNQHFLTTLQTKLYWGMDRRN